MESSGGYAPGGKDTGFVKPKGSSSIRAHEGLETVPMRDRKPEWLKVRSPGGSEYLRLKGLMRSQALHTVCEEAPLTLPASGLKGCPIRAFFKVRPGRPRGPSSDHPKDR